MIALHVCLEFLHHTQKLMVDVLLILKLELDLM